MPKRPGWTFPRPTVAVAHRGAHGVGRPHNSLAAVRRAVELGAHAVELDVFRARDGGLYASHEPGTRAEPALPLLKLVAESDLLLVLDWKGGGGEEVAADLLAQLQLTHRTVVSTGDAAALRRFKARRHGLTTGLTLEGSALGVALRLWPRAFAARAGAVMLERGAMGRLSAAMARLAGLGLFTWTVNDQASYLALRRFRPDGIMTDAVEEVLRGELSPEPSGEPAATPEKRTDQPPDHQGGE